MFEREEIPNFGWGSTVLQIYYPLSPSLAVLYYDEKVYKVGYRKRSYVDLTDISNVNTLNMLLAANARERIFFSDGISDTYIKQLCSWVQPKYLKEKREEIEINVSPIKSFIVARYKHHQIRF